VIIYLRVKMGFQQAVIAQKERRLPNNARRFFPQSPDSSGEILPSIQTGFFCL
jgi:hypothetical protein